MASKSGDSMPDLAPGEQRKAVKKHGDDASEIVYDETKRLKLADFSAPSNKGDGTLLEESTTSTEKSVIISQGKL